MKNILILLMLVMASYSIAGQNKIINEVTNKYKENQASKNPENFLIKKLQDSKEVDFIQVLKSNYNASQTKRLFNSINKMNETISSECFSDFWSQRKLIQTNGKTNNEVLNHIKGSTVGVELVSYYSLKSTVGYTYPNTNKIWTNERKQKGYDYCRIASNLAHEGSHKIGYGHDYYRTPNRNYSVPYSINAGFTKCCKFLNETKEKVKSCFRSWKTLWLVKYCN